MSLRFTQSLLLAAALFTLSGTERLAAQQIIWSNQIGGNYNDLAFSCALTADGGYALLGATFSFGSGDHDIYLLRLNGYGDTLWTKTMGGAAADYGYDLKQTSDGGFIVVGATRSFGDGLGDIYLAKISWDGEMEWFRTYGGAESDEARSIALTSDKGFILCGTTKSYGAGNGDLYLIRLDSLGNMLWSRTFGGPAGDAGWAVATCADGGFIAGGATGSFGQGYSSMYAVRVDDNGDSLWAYAYGGDNSDFGYDIVQALDGGFVIAGSSASFGAGYSDAYLVKIDTAGIVEWEQTFGGVKDDRAYSICRTADGGYVMGGFTASSGAGRTDIYIVKTDPLGVEEWSRVYGGTKTDHCRAVIEDLQLGIIVAGYTYSLSRGGADIYVMKIGTPLMTSVEMIDDEPLPDDFQLSQNYPNPFNITTRIDFALGTRSDVTLGIYNVLGRLIREYRYSFPRGSYSLEWDGRNQWGQTVASGIYFYRLHAGDFIDTKKMVLVK